MKTAQNTTAQTAELVITVAEKSHKPYLGLRKLKRTLLNGKLSKKLTKNHPTDESIRYKLFGDCMRILMSINKYYDTSNDLDGIKALEEAYRKLFELAHRRELTRPLEFYTIDLGNGNFKVTSKKVGDTMKVTIEVGSAILKEGLELHEGDFVICSYNKPCNGEPCVLFYDDKPLDILPYNHQIHKNFTALSVTKIGTASIKDMA